MDIKPQIAEKKAQEANDQFIKAKNEANEQKQIAKKYQDQTKLHAESISQYKDELEKLTSNLIKIEQDKYLAEAGLDSVRTQLKSLKTGAKKTEIELQNENSELKVRLKELGKNPRATSPR